MGWLFSIVTMFFDGAHACKRKHLCRNSDAFLGFNSIGNASLFTDSNLILSWFASVFSFVPPEKYRPALRCIHRSVRHDGLRQITVCIARFR